MAIEDLLEVDPVGNRRAAGSRVPPVVRARSAGAAMSTTCRSWSRMKATERPSGLNWGYCSRPGWFVRRTAVAPSNVA